MMGDDSDRDGNRDGDGNGKENEGDGKSGRGRTESKKRPAEKNKYRIAPVGISEGVIVDEMQNYLGQETSARSYSHR
jgi:hypothetical protein